MCGLSGLQPPKYYICGTSKLITLALAATGLGKLEQLFASTFEHWHQKRQSIWII